MSFSSVNFFFQRKVFFFTVAFFILNFFFEDYTTFFSCLLSQVPLKTEFLKSHTARRLPSSLTKQSTNIFLEHVLQMCTKLLYSLHSSRCTCSRKLARWLQMIFMAKNLLTCLRRKSPVWLMCRSVWSVDNALTLMREQRPSDQRYKRYLISSRFFSNPSYLLDILSFLSFILVNP